MEKLTIVDPHCHMWDLDTGYFDWLKNNEGNEFLGDFAGMRGNYLPVDYLRDTSDFHVKQFIHVQAADYRYAKQEAEWVISLTKYCPQLAAIVTGIDLLSPDAQALLEFYSSSPLIKGVRQFLNWHQKSRYTATDRADDLINPQWQKRYALLEKYQLSFDMQICPGQLQDAACLAKQYPNIRVILEHAGFPLAEELAVWEAGIAHLATCANVVIKISGFGMFDRQWYNNTDFSMARIRYILQHFGVDRSMFASNFPVDKLYSNFTTLYTHYQHTVADLSATEQEKLFVKNAQRVYSI